MIQLENVYFSYAENQESLHDISLTISPGSVVCLCGPSGCGKTTITRLLNGLIPHFFDGQLVGNIRIDGKSVTETSLYELSDKVGSVFQNPKTQFFCLNTSSELAFECENQGKDPIEIKKRISELTQDLQMKSLVNRNIFRLSGGQKQLIACASVSIGDNELVVLDEPSSNLDMEAIKQLQKIIHYWKKNGKTVIVAEHRLHYLMALADKFICMKEGKILREFSNKDLCAASTDTIEQLGLRPTHMMPLKKREEKISDERSMLTLTNFVYRYTKNDPKAIDIEKLEIKRGQIVAIIGANGAGKSTFARCFCGLEKKFSGAIKLNDKTYTKKKLQQLTYMVLQDVNNQLFTESVEEELLLGNRMLAQEKMDSCLKKMNLLEFSDRHPLSLSGGQQQRVAIASAMVSEKEVLLFDEPTSGLDLFHMNKVVDMLRELKEMGKTIFLISHDYELLMKCADSVIHIQQGKISDQYVLTPETSKKLTEFFVK